MRRFSIEAPHHVKRLVRVTGMMCMAHLGFSAPPPYDAENTINTHIEKYMTTYDTLSTWICHGAVFAPGRRDYREAPGKSL